MDLTRKVNSSAPNALRERSVLVFMKHALLIIMLACTLVEVWPRDKKLNVWAVTAVIWCGAWYVSRMEIERDR